MSLRSTEMWPDVMDLVIDATAAGKLLSPEDVYLVGGSLLVEGMLAEDWIAFTNDR